MKNKLLIIGMVLLLAGCSDAIKTDGILVQNMDELQQAIDQAEPGDEIVLANGVWKDAQIKFSAQGTEAAPITLRAETAGAVFLEGESFLHLGGDYLVASGLYFRNGYSPESGVIKYRTTEDTNANHCRVTACVIDGFTRLNRWDRDSWIEFYGKHNQLDHCYIAGKANDGATLMVYHKGNEHINSYHQIVDNYFGPRPRKGGPRAETIRFGSSETSMAPGKIMVKNNYFEACNGEVEIISDKTNFNSFVNNIFYKCEGSLVIRHGNYATIDGNIFIGGDDSDFYGGIRAVNSGHWITNNYFYKIRGEEFRSPIAIMNGIPKSSLNRYKQVTDVVVAYNTWVDCKSPLQIGVGQNKASADVLPASEIRSAPPIRTTLANNLIYNTQADAVPLVNHDDMSGVLFKNNIIDNAGTSYSAYEALQNGKVEVKQINDWLYVPVDAPNSGLDTVFAGYDFEKINKDLFGSSRTDNNRIGAIASLAAAEQFEINKKNYGPDWFTPATKSDTPEVHMAASAEELAEKLAAAQAGDVIELSGTSYTLNTSLQVDKEITLRSKGKDKVQLLFSGAENTAAFSMNPGGNLTLENIALKGQRTQLAFAPLDKNMASPYKLFADNCQIDNFEYVLKASKGSFADSISMRNTALQNCTNGLVLAADEKGDYNAEMVTFESCTFTNIQQNVIHFYRGGYDESTIGGFLRMNNNLFTACGEKEKSGVLLKTRGIINVHLRGNTFRNNPVQLVALLWGEKNNEHSDNTLIQSGKIKVEEQQKLEILY